MGWERLNLTMRAALFVCLKYPDFYLYNIYFPNGGQANQRAPYKLDFYAFLLGPGSMPCTRQASR